MPHIHVHLHTKDAGTSEGARKAAITRKQGGGGPQHTFTRAQAEAHRHLTGAGHQHREQLPSGAHHYIHPKTQVSTEVRKNGEVHYPGTKLRSRMTAAVAQKTAIGKFYQDAGTSEGARKAAQTRKTHQGAAVSYLKHQAALKRKPGTKQHAAAQAAARRRQQVSKNQPERFR